MKAMRCENSLVVNDNINSFIVIPFISHKCMMSDDVGKYNKIGSLGYVSNEDAIRCNGRILEELLPSKKNDLKRSEYLDTLLMISFNRILRDANASIDKAEKRNIKSLYELTGGKIKDKKHFSDAIDKYKRELLSLMDDSSNFNSIRELINDFDYNCDLFNLTDKEKEGLKRVFDIEIKNQLLTIRDMSAIYVLDTLVKRESHDSISSSSNKKASLYFKDPSISDEVRRRMKKYFCSYIVNMDTEISSLKDVRNAKRKYNDKYNMWLGSGNLRNRLMFKYGVSENDLDAFKGNVLDNNNSLKY